MQLKVVKKLFKNSLDFYSDITNEGEKLKDEDLIKGLTFCIDRVISEGSLYSKKLASKSYKKKCRRYFKCFILFKSS